MNNPAAEAVGSCPFLPGFGPVFCGSVPESGGRAFFLAVSPFFAGGAVHRAGGFCTGRFCAASANAVGCAAVFPPPHGPRGCSRPPAAPGPPSAFRAGFRPAFRFGRAAAEGAGLFAALLPFLNKINKDTGAAPARVCACPAHGVLIQKYRPRIHCARSAKFYPGFAVAVTILIRGRPVPRSR